MTFKLHSCSLYGLIIWGQIHVFGFLVGVVSGCLVGFFVKNLPCKPFLQWLLFFWLLFLAHWWSMVPSLIFMLPPYLFWVISICCRREWFLGWLRLTFHPQCFILLERWNTNGANGHRIWLRGKTQWEKVPWLVVLIDHLQLLELSWESLVSIVIVHGYANQECLLHVSKIETPYLCCTVNACGKLWYAVRGALLVLKWYVIAF